MTNRDRAISASRQLAKAKQKNRLEPIQPEKTASPRHPSQPSYMRTIRFVGLCNDYTPGTDLVVAGD